VGKPERDLAVNGRVVIYRNARKYEERIWTRFI
jgi:hypothetical protein